MSCGEVLPLRGLLPNRETGVNQLLDDGMGVGKGSQVLLGRSREYGACGAGRAGGEPGKMVILELYLLRTLLMLSG